MILKIAVVIDVAIAIGMKYTALNTLEPGSFFFRRTASRNPTAACTNTVPKKKMMLFTTAVQKVLSFTSFA